jgi:hypothetical protein
MSRFSVQPLDNKGFILLIKSDQGEAGNWSACNLRISIENVYNWLIYTAPTNTSADFERFCRNWLIKTGFK